MNPEPLAPEAPSRKIVIAYWVTTLLLAAQYAAAGVVDFVQPAHVRDLMAHLGYPPYFSQMLGTAKLLAVVALLVPGFPTIREWAYAGITFNLLAASWSHFQSGDAIRHIATPLAILVLSTASYVLWRRVARMTAVR